jgi:hypothetical protein
MSLLEFVDTHYNKYAQLESQTIREAGRSSRSVGWLAAEFVGPEKGNCVAVSWLQFVDPAKGRSAWWLADGSRAKLSSCQLAGCGTAGP